MIKKAKNITIIILSLFLVISGSIFYIKANSKKNIVRALGKLTVTFPSEPLFSESNWYPGKNISKSFTVSNADLETKKIGIKATDIIDHPLSSVIEIIISQNSTFLYGSGSVTGKKTLSDFYSDEVWLGEVKRGQSINYEIKLKMEESAGDEYQGQRTGFDLLVGTEIEKILSIPTLAPMPTIQRILTIEKLPPRR